MQPRSALGVLGHQGVIGFCSCPTLRTNLGLAFCSYLLMLNSQLVAKPNPLSALSGLCWSAAVVLLPSQASKALCAAAIQRRSAELTPERLPNIPRIQQPSADKSETRVPWGK